MSRFKTNNRNFEQQEIGRSWLASRIIAWTALTALMSLPAIALAGKGGKQPPTDDPPQPITDNTTIFFCVDFDNLSEDRVQSDGFASSNYPFQYCNGEDDFAAQVWGQVGNSDMYSTPSAKNRKNKPFDRRVFLDFTHVEDAPELPAGGNVDVHIRFRSQTVGHLGNMAFPDTDPATNFWLAFEDIHGDTWHLWYSDYDGADGEISRVDGFTWYVTGTLAYLINSSTGTHLGLVDMPMGMTWVDMRQVEWLYAEP